MKYKCYINTFFTIVFYVTRDIFLNYLDYFNEFLKALKADVSAKAGAMLDALRARISPCLPGWGLWLHVKPSIAIECSRQSVPDMT
jgi:hypothetical protein